MLYLCVCVDNVVVVLADHVKAVERDKREDEHKERRFGRCNSNAACLCNVDLLLEEFVLTYNSINATGYAAEKKRGDKTHNCVDALLNGNCVVVFYHNVPNVECIDTTGD